MYEFVTEVWCAYDELTGTITRRAYAESVDGESAYGSARPAAEFAPQPADPVGCGARSTSITRPVAHIGKDLDERPVPARKEKAALQLPDLLPPVGRLPTWVSGVALARVAASAHIGDAEMRW